MIGNYMLDTIYNEDCLSAMESLPDESIDLIVTDPPYLMNYKTGRRKIKGHRFSDVIIGDDDEEVISKVIEQCYRVMKPNTAMYMFCNTIKIDFFKQELEKHFNVKNIIVWVKNNHTAGDLQAAYGRKYENIILVNKGRKKFNGYRYNDVWEFDRVSGNAQLHQNQKPYDLIERCILSHSDKGEVVLDPFMGSGTTALVAKNNGRRYLGYELDDGYYQIAKERVDKDVR